MLLIKMPDMQGVGGFSIITLANALKLIDPQFGEDWRIRLETLHQAVLAYQSTRKSTAHSFLEANGRGDRFAGFYRLEQKDGTKQATSVEAKSQAKSILFTKTGFLEALLKTLLHYLTQYGNEVRIQAN